MDIVQKPKHTEHQTHVKIFSNVSNKNDGAVQADMNMKSK
jgi:hypothetical protein